MNDTERIMLECRYLLSLNKNYVDIAKRLNVSEDLVFNDLNYQLPKMDQILYHQIQKKIEKFSLYK